jgi:hypothetical protein
LLVYDFKNGSTDIRNHIVSERWCVWNASVSHWYRSYLKQEQR